MFCQYPLFHGTFWIWCFLHGLLNEFIYSVQVFPPFGQTISRMCQQPNLNSSELYLNSVKTHHNSSYEITILQTWNKQIVNFPASFIKPSTYKNKVFLNHITKTSFIKLQTKHILNDRLGWNSNLATHMFMYGYKLVHNHTERTHNTFLKSAYTVVFKRRKQHQMSSHSHYYKQKQKWHSEYYMNLILLTTVWKLLTSCHFPFLVGSAILISSLWICCTTPW